MKKFLLRLFGLDMEIVALKNAVYDMTDFVFDNAKFPDDTGKADGDYNSDQVLAKWNKFHELNQNIRKAERKLKVV